MGNHKFRLSDMVPNALFDKLRHMKKTSTRAPPSTKGKGKEESSSAKISQKPHLRQQQGSSHFFDRKQRISGNFYTSSPSNTHFPDSPGRSSKRRSKRKTIYKPSPKLPYKCQDAGLSPQLVQSSDYFVSSRERSREPDILREVLISEPKSYSFPSTGPLQGITTLSRPCNCKFSSTTADRIVDMNEQSFTRTTSELEEIDLTSEIELPPIPTKPRNIKVNQSGLCLRSFFRKKRLNSHLVKNVNDENSRTDKEHKMSPLARKRSGCPIMGIRLRANSPKISSKKLQACARKSVSSSTGLYFKNKTISGSIAVEKSSKDPQRDFRDSMMEMILKKDIRTTEDLEDLLGFYLELNSNEFHDLIIRAFEQILLDMTEGFL